MKTSVLAGIFSITASFLFVGDTQAVITLLDGPAGGDCGLVGTWDLASRTCTLSGPVDNSIHVASANITLDCAGNALTGPDPAGFHGVLLAYGSDGSTVRNCDISKFGNGLLLIESGNHRVHDNLIHQNAYNGIVARYSTDNLIENNVVSQNAASGLLLLNTGNHRVQDNLIQQNARNGIYAWTSSSNRIEGNLVSQNAAIGGVGIRLLDDQYSVLRNNTLAANFSTGLSIMVSQQLEVTGNLLNDNGAGGLHAWQVQDSLIANNMISGHWASSDAIGMDLGASTRLVLSGNRMQDNRFNFDINVLYPEHYDHEIDTSNTVDGNKIYYLKGLVDTLIDPAAYDGAGSIYCLGCSGVTITGFNFDSHSGTAIALVDTHDSVVRDNTVREYRAGVRTLVSDHNAIRRNDIYVTSPWAMGLEFSPLADFLRLGGNDNLVEDNIVNAPYSTISAVRVNGDRYVIRNNRILSGSSLEVFSNDALIEGNVLRNSGGIRVLRSDNVVVVGNTVRDGTPNLGAPEFPGRKVWDENGLQVHHSNNVLIIGNRVRDMLDDGLEILNSTGVTVTRNDIHGNALVGTNANGDNVYQVFSDSPIELSDSGMGNYWGRNCGQGDSGAPLFRPGIDSNAIDVMDSNPYRNPIAQVPINANMNHGSCPQ